MNLTEKPIFQLPLRLFYPLAALVATLVPMWIVGYMVNGYPFGGRLFRVVTWHGFEMFFGFGIALIAGFLLTAGAAWSGKAAVSGKPLLILASLWSLERLCLFAPVNPKIAAVVCIVCGIYFLFLALKLLWGYKVFPLFASILICIFIAKLLYIFDALHIIDHGIKMGETLMVNTIRLLIIIICGRIIPSFSNGKIKDLNIKVPTIINGFAIGTGILMIPITLFISEELFVSIFTGITCFAQILRFVYWKPFRTASTGMLSILNIGFLWIILSLLLESLLPYYPELGIGRATLHSFAAGGLGVLSIATMTRSGLGHTGREITMSKMVACMFVWINLGAFVRVFAPIYRVDFYLPSLHISMGIWTLAFIFFLIKFMPIFLTKRPDGKSN